jgi:hypothetical protein
MRPDTLPEFGIIRDYQPEATIGRFVSLEARTGYPPMCYTLERPRVFKGIFNRKDDPKTEINESCCFPEGRYLVEWTYSPRFARNMFLINVDGWEGLRIHPANNVEQLLGCVSPCLRIVENVKYGGKVHRYWADYGKYTGKAKDFVRDVLESKLPKKFWLTIKSNESLCDIDNAKAQYIKEMRV